MCEAGLRLYLTMVGDREHDMIGALANGMNAVGVIYGFGSLQELLEAGTDLG